MAHEQITKNTVPLIQPKERSHTLHPAGVDITPLVSGHQADDYEVGVISGQRGHGPPPHSHPWDATSFVLHGEKEHASMSLLANDPEGSLAENYLAVALRYGEDDRREG